jgi:hypothetical protein
MSERSGYEAIINPLHIKKQTLNQGFTNSKSLHYYASLNMPQKIGSFGIPSSKCVWQDCITW